MQKIVLTNQKGGVAKTTTAHALATGLHNRQKLAAGGKKKNYSILVVDCDPQSNLSYACGVDEYRDGTLYDVLKGKCKTKDAIRTTDMGIDVLTIGIAGAAADMELASKTAREYMLSEALDGLKYDYCIIDTCPSLGLLTLNALTAADGAIIPMNVEMFSLMGAEQLQEFIQNVKKHTNKGLKTYGLLLTKYHERQNITQALQDNIDDTAKLFNSIVFDTHIRESAAVRDNFVLRGDLYAEYPKAAATVDYKTFVDEFIRRYGK